MSTQIYSGVLNVHHCPTCGVAYGLDSDYDDRRRSNGQGWHCPNGHNVVYTESQEKKLRKQLARETHRADQLKSEVDYQKRLKNRANNRLAATKGVVTKIKKRIGNGVCPHCNRYFKNLHRHMCTKHTRAKGVKKCKGSKSSMKS